MVSISLFAKTFKVRK